MAELPSQHNRVPALNSGAWSKPDGNFSIAPHIHYHSVVHAAVPLDASIPRALRSWWRDRRASHGSLAVLAMLVGDLWGFLRDSTPARSRQRYGDIDYDWDYRVNTTSGAVRWRDRLLGVLHSAYQPTEPEMFREMLDRLDIDFSQFVFVDLGSGKGRTLLMAANYPFRSIVGVELLPELHRIAQENLRIYQSKSQACHDIVSVCADARHYEFPADPLVLYLFHPLPRTGLETVIENLHHSLRMKARPVIVIYYNPVFQDLLQKSTELKSIISARQYAIYSNF